MNSTLNNPDNAKRLTFENPEVFKTFIHPEEVVEVRILNARGKCPLISNDYIRGTVSGYFDNHADLWKYVQAVEKMQNKGIYFTVQVIDPRLHARAYNRLKISDLTTKDTDVIAYRFLPIDIDPERPSGIPSSDSELAESVKLSMLLEEYVMTEYGLAKPIRAMSGNGVHLLFRLPDLPVTKENVAFVEATLKTLSKLFSNDKAKIDESVFNPSRILRLYGTVTRKGDSLPAGPGREARPHRLSFIEDLGGPND
jgi:hypothetical protein